ncbi:MAG: potassium transporter TrkA [Cyanobacteria bacterium RU_5_0]|nr:potassium transporter TrkA [Cyanobacteria bacterium RU_5_0]
MCAERTIEPALFGVIIPPNSSHCGLRLSAIQIPERCALLGILRQERIIPISDNPSVYVGDVVLAIALHPMLVPALNVALKRSHPVYYSLNNCLLKTPVTQKCCRLF